MSSTALTLRSVSKQYSTGGHSFKALDQVDLDIEKGKLVVILGPSDAGKSTLLNLIGGMDIPSEGTITVNGTDISTYSENELQDCRFGSSCCRRSAAGIVCDSSDESQIIACIHRRIVQNVLS